MKINRKTKIALIIFISIFNFFSFKAIGASFDCNKAFTSIEKMICNDNVLSSLDTSMALLYEEKKDKNLIKSQRNWIKNIRNKTSSINDLTIEYSNRINYLANYRASNTNNSVDNSQNVPPKVKEENNITDNSRGAYPKIKDYANDFVVIQGIPYSTTRTDTNTTGNIMRCAEILTMDLMMIARKQAENENSLKEFVRYKDRIYTASWNFNIDQLEKDINNPEVIFMCNLLIQGSRGIGLY